MSEPRRYTWQVEGTTPAAESNSGKTWAQNLHIQVIAVSLEEAVAAVRAKHPDYTFHKCWRDRYINDVIVVGQTEGEGTDRE